MIEQYPVPQPVRDDTTTQYQDPIRSCEHRSEVRKMLCDNGTVQYRKQCTKCGTGSQALAKRTLTVYELDHAPPFDRELEQNIRHVASQQRRSASDDKREQWFKWYNGYLASPVWDRRRAQVLRQCGRVCEACRKAEAVIAHHLTYDHVGAEPLYELAGVCAPCHDYLHPQGEAT